MTDTSVNLTGNVSLQEIKQCFRPRHGEQYSITIQTAGTFGSGTVSYFISNNNGINKVPMKDLDGTAYTVTSDDIITSSFDTSGNNSTPVRIYATLAGASSPNINISMTDNRN